MDRKCKLKKFDTPEDYPIELIPTNRKLKSNEVAFDKLKSVVKLGTKNC